MASTAPNLLGPSSVAVNAGAGPRFDVLEVGHPDYVALINADTAFWVLSPREEALAYVLGAELPQTFQAKEAKLAADLNNVRFGLLPSAVYFNPTERCNLDCGYCYLPREARRAGSDMEPGKVLEALSRLKDYFVSTLPEGRQAAARLPRRRTAAGQGRGLPGHRAVRRLLPLRRPDQRRAAGPKRPGFSEEAGLRHRHLPGRPHRRDRQPHPAHLGRQRRLRSRPSRSWRSCTTTPG